jgi:DNA polymerase delta subunit 1
LPDTIDFSLDSDDEGEIDYGQRSEEDINELEHDIDELGDYLVQEEGAEPMGEDTPAEEPEDIFDDTPEWERDMTGKALLDDVKYQLDQTYKRPDPGLIDPHTTDIVFQSVDIDYTTRNQNPVIRIFGITRDRCAVTVYATGFRPYMYLRIARVPSTDEMNGIMAAINRELRNAKGKRNLAPVVKIEYDTKVDIYGFKGPLDRKIENTLQVKDMEHYHFVKITLQNPSSISYIRKLFEDGIGVTLHKLFSNSNGKFIHRESDGAIVTYESNIPYVMRAMIDKKGVGAAFIRIPAGTYHLVASQYEKHSTSQIEVKVEFEHVEFLDPKDPKNADIVPMRILTFDIECIPADKEVVDRMPHPYDRDAHKKDGVMVGGDPVSMIGCKIREFGSDRVHGVNYRYTLFTCHAIDKMTVLRRYPDCDIHILRTERDMLLAWRYFVSVFDPDILSGYNINNFDLNYLLNRAMTLGIHSTFTRLGRVDAERSRLVVTVFESSAYGRKETIRTTMPGRWQIDMLEVIQRDHKLSSYTLNNVGQHFLGTTKDDVSPLYMREMTVGSPITCAIVGIYCLKDNEIPDRVMEKLMIVPNLVEMARVTGVPPSFLLEKGQQVKVHSLLLRKAGPKGGLIVVPLRLGETDYKGARVIDPKKGYYVLPVATLDFASLYPSIMIHKNLCYMTAVSMEEAEMLERHNPGCITRTEITEAKSHCFVKPWITEGLLPEILADLLAERKHAKALMGEAKKRGDKDVAAVMDGRQLALKVSANSVYGFTGASIGKLPMLSISESVTYTGYEWLCEVERAVIKMFSFAPGNEVDKDGKPLNPRDPNRRIANPHQVRVIYGDTDSVMVIFGKPTVGECIDLGREAARRITEEVFKAKLRRELTEAYGDKKTPQEIEALVKANPVSLEFEKVYWHYLLLGKKMYAGGYYTNADAPDRLEAKGVKMVRRDSSLFIKTLEENVLRSAVLHRDKEMALEHFVNGLQMLQKQKVPLHMLIASKRLNKDPDQYTKSRGPHVHLALRHNEKNKGNPKKSGDRISYLIRSSRSNKVGDCSVDPQDFLRENMQLNMKYYMDGVKKEMYKIIRPLVNTKDDADRLFAGRHTVLKTGTNQDSISRFLSVQSKCACCGQVEHQAFAKTQPTPAQKQTVLARTSPSVQYLSFDSQGMTPAEYKNALRDARANDPYMSNVCTLKKNEPIPRHQLEAHLAELLGHKDWKPEDSDEEYPGAGFFDFPGLEDMVDSHTIHTKVYPSETRAESDRYNVTIHNDKYRSRPVLCKSCNTTENKLDRLRKETKKLEDMTKRLNTLRLTCIECQDGKVDAHPNCINSECGHGIFYERLSLRQDREEKEITVKNLLDW